MPSKRKAARNRSTRSSAVQRLEPFAYEALEPGQIRVFQFVHRRNFGRQLLGSLRVIDLQDNPETDVPYTTEPYFALSYAWGSKDESFPLICDGDELRIHKNLRDALLRLRDICDSVPLWVDAICINQMDDNEKLVQIRQMPEIFTAAVKVFAWVGEEVKGGRRASALMSQVNHLRALYPGPSAITDEALLETFKLPTPSSPKWSSVIALSTNSWFRRLWVLQEAALAKELIFVQGSQMIMWDVLNTFTSSYSVLPYWKRPIDFDADSSLLSTLSTREATQTIRKIRVDNGPYESAPGPELAFSMGATVMLSRSKTCSDPRDRVLALLGFLDKQVRNKLGFESVTTEEHLYVRFCRLLLIIARDMTRLYVFILASAYVRRRAISLPSWCPDFHSLFGVASLQRNAFHSSSRRPIGGEKPLEWGQFIVQGISVNIITTVVTGKWSRIQYCTPSELKSNLEWLRSCAALSVRDKLETLVTSSFTEILPDNVDALWRALIMDQISCDDRLLSISDWQSLVGILINAMEGIRGNKSMVQYNGRTPVYIECIESAQKLQQGHRRYVGTENGRVGWGPYDVQSGDMVCVLYGANVPFILRPAAKQGTYILVGEAYIHGIMYGEAEALGIEPEEFVLV